MKKAFAAVAVFLAIILTGCSAADVASRNVSEKADNFEIQRRIVFYNGITGKYILVIEGRCSLGNNDTELRMTVTCKTGPDEYKKHYLGLSDNVTFFMEQLDAVKVSEWHYKVRFRPETLGPDIDIDTSGEKPR